MPRKDPAARLEYQNEYKLRVGKGVIKRKHRSWRLQKVYGISLEDYESLFEAQGGCCAICRKHQTEFPRGYSLAVDHDHETGEVRGLVCYPCNTLLSKGVDFFERGVEYFNTLPVGMNGEIIQKRPRNAQGPITEVDRNGKIVYNG